MRRLPRRRFLRLGFLRWRFLRWRSLEGKLLRTMLVVKLAWWTSLMRRITDRCGYLSLANNLKVWRSLKIWSILGHTDKDFSCDECSLDLKNNMANVPEVNNETASCTCSSLNTISV